MLSLIYYVFAFFATALTKNYYLKCTKKHRKLCDFF